MSVNSPLKPGKIRRELFAEGTSHETKILAFASRLSRHHRAYEIRRCREQCGLTLALDRWKKCLWVKLGTTGLLACYDFDGKEIWSFNLQERYKPFSMYHGMSSSPLIHNGLVYLCRENGVLICLDAKTGERFY